MFVRLKEKPFYFLTDRQTKYTYLVDNRNQKSTRHLYYPEQFETMSAGQIRGYKWKMVYQMMGWAMLNGDKMTVTDKKICMSKMFDFGFTLFTGLVMGSFMRRALFRIEMPFFDIAFEHGLFKPRWIKSVAAYSLAGIIIYNGLKTIMKEQYLVDLAYEYRYNFNKTLTCQPCDMLLKELCTQRFETPRDKTIIQNM